ncbi:MAG TPA: type 4a pilus biogenesis protein PilO [Burkholderiaceae bacterium]|nr:type 4a pilus biogenesis protein PilO [Burkholderiaceae bacterium]
MATLSSKKLDLAKIQESIISQFRGTDLNDPGSWKSVPKYLAYALVTLAIVGLLWALWVTNSRNTLLAEEAKETDLRAEYSKKLAKAANLEALKKQRAQVMQYVTDLEKQLPSKAEMDALLSDINQAGIGRKLQFDLFKPGQVKLQDYYAELPISVKVTGGYHDIGSFVADVADLSRIVTLTNLSITPVASRDGVLSLEATTNTFRYLDSEELATQRKIKADKAKVAGAKS